MSRKPFKIALLSVTVILLCLPAYALRKHDDVEDIGNRNVAGRVWAIFPNFVSLEKEIELGAQIAAEFEQTAKLMDDAVINEYIDRIGQDLVKHSDAKVPFHIKVVDSDEVNAFAFPGGYFYVNKGLILEAENESELAGVMAHEISHVTARHATSRMSKSQILQVASLPALFVGGYWTQMAIQNGLGMGINLKILGITRESEREADQLGIQYLWNTGYDPNGFVTFFEKLKREEKTKPTRLLGWFRTHPSTDDRIVAALDEQRFLPEKDRYIVNTSEFSRIKARLENIDNLRKSEQKEINSIEQKRPTLKRKSEQEGEDGSANPEEKRRPTLKRPTSPDSE